MRSMRIAFTISMLLLAAFAYAATGGLLYRQRVNSSSEFWDSDALVFFIPILLSVLLNTAIIILGMHWRTLPRYLIACALAVVTTMVAMASYMIVVFDIYGT
jgi:hypothetical protein